jgi:hypothetical protein
MDKLIVVERGDLVMVFNFHPTKSFTDYKIGCMNAGEGGAGLCACFIALYLCALASWPGGVTAC